MSSESNGGCVGPFFTFMLAFFGIGTVCYLLAGYIDDAAGTGFNTFFEAFISVVALAILTWQIVGNYLTKTNHDTRRDDNDDRKRR